MGHFHFGLGQLLPELVDAVLSGRRSTWMWSKGRKSGSRLVKLEGSKSTMLGSCTRMVFTRSRLSSFSRSCCESSFSQVCR